MAGLSGTVCPPQQGGKKRKRRSSETGAQPPRNPRFGNANHNCPGKDSSFSLPRSDPSPRPSPHVVEHQPNTGKQFGIPTDQSMIPAASQANHSDSPGDGNVDDEPTRPEPSYPSVTSPRASPANETRSENSPPLSTATNELPCAEVRLVHTIDPSNLGRPMHQLSTTGGARITPVDTVEMGWVKPSTRPAGGIIEGYGTGTHHIDMSLAAESSLLYSGTHEEDLQYEGSFDAFIDLCGDVRCEEL